MWQPRKADFFHFNKFPCLLMLSTFEGFFLQNKLSCPDACLRLSGAAGGHHCLRLYLSSTVLTQLNELTDCKSMTWRAPHWSPTVPAHKIQLHLSRCPFMDVMASLQTCEAALCHREHMMRIRPSKARCYLSIPYNAGEIIHFVLSVVIF